MGTLRSGLVSVTFRNKAPEEILEIATRGGAEGIEWSGDCHVPPGEPDLARDVMIRTLRARMTVASYGSYYRLIRSERNGMPFETVLRTANDLLAPILRIWAGDKPSRGTSAPEFKSLVDEARRCARMAAIRGVTVAFELHQNTYADSAVSTKLLMEAIDDPFIRLIWAPSPGRNDADYADGIAKLAPWIVGLRCHDWKGTSERLPLEGRDGAWLPGLKLFHDAISPMPLDRYAFINFVRDDAEASYLEDAKTLNGWLESLRRPR